MDSTPFQLSVLARPELSLLFPISLPLWPRLPRGSFITPERLYDADWRQRLSKERPFATEALSLLVLVTFPFSPLQNTSSGPACLNFFNISSQKQTILSLLELFYLPLPAFSRVRDIPLPPQTSSSLSARRVGKSAIIQALWNPLSCGTS